MGSGPDRPGHRSAPGEEGCFEREVRPPGARGGQAGGRDGQRGAGGGTPGQAPDPAPVGQAPRQPERRWINEARSRIVMEFVPLNAANANTIDRKFYDLRYNTDVNQKALDYQAWNADTLKAL